MGGSRRQLAFPLVTSVLEPDLHLGFRQSERCSQLRPFGAGQIALRVEGRLQLEDLTAREDRSRLLLPVVTWPLVLRQRPPTTVRILRSTSAADARSRSVAGGGLQGV